MDKISVIVPVFNAEKYIEKTLKALSSQTYENIEIILIDDGSTDNSYALCKEVSQKDSRFLCYKIENNGPSNARNVGLSKATGKYVGFCDADDLPKENMYQTLAEYLEKSHADIALCDMYTERDGKNFGFPWGDNTVFSGEAISDNLMAKMIGNSSDNDDESPIWGSVVRCLFKREIVEKNNIKFPTDIYFAEDLVFTLGYLSVANKAVICDKVLYFYTCNEESIMNSFSSYKKGMFQARLKLVSYIEGIISKINYKVLKSRLMVTERCYYSECIGNACRNAQGRTKKDKKAEIFEIVYNEKVKNAFQKFYTKDIKNKLKYSLIKGKKVGLLYLYYSLRFR